MITDNKRGVSSSKGEHESQKCQAREPRKDSFFWSICHFLDLQAGSNSLTVSTFLMMLRHLSKTAASSEKSMSMNLLMTPSSARSFAQLFSESMMTNLQHG